MPPPCPPPPEYRLFVRHPALPARAPEARLREHEEQAREQGEREGDAGGDAAPRDDQRVALQHGVEGAQQQGQLGTVLH